MSLRRALSYTLALFLTSTAVIADEFETLLDRECGQVLSRLKERHVRPGALATYERFFGGTREREIASFEQIFFRILGAQGVLAPQNSGNRGRVMHRKPLGGGLLTEVTVLEVPSYMRHGLFARPGDKLIAMSRFSGGMGTNVPDALPDVTGYAIKILDVSSSAPAVARVSTGDAPPPEVDDLIRAWDVTFTKSASGFAASPTKFLQLADALATRNIFVKGVRMVGWALTQPKAAYRLATSVARPLSSVLLQEYGSGHPYLIGGVPYKFSVSLDPVLPQGVTGDVVNPDDIVRGVGGFRNLGGRLRRAVTDRDYLSTDVLDWVGQGDVYLTMYAQPAPHGRSEAENVHNVENGLVSWGDEYAKIPVLRLRILHAGGARGRVSPVAHTPFVEGLGFNPGNYFGDHRAAGVMGRGREWAYLASQLGRWFRAGDYADPATGTFRFGQDLETQVQAQLQELVRIYREQEAYAARRATP